MPNITLHCIYLLNLCLYCIYTYLPLFILHIYLPNQHFCCIYLYNLTFISCILVCLSNCYLIFTYLIHTCIVCNHTLPILQLHFLSLPTFYCTYICLPLYLLHIYTYIYLLIKPTLYCTYTYLS